MFVFVANEDEGGVIVIVVVVVIVHVVNVRIVIGRELNGWCGSVVGAGVVWCSGSCCRSGGGSGVGVGGRERMDSRSGGC